MGEIESLQFSEIRTATHQALRALLFRGAAPPVFERLLVVKHQANHGLAGLREFLEERIAGLASEDPQSASLLTERFVHGMTTNRLALQENLSSDQINRRQRTAIDKLARQIYEGEIRQRRAHAQAIAARLQPKSYAQLFGVDKDQQLLSQKLIDPSHNAVLAIIGLGGIGKTALADKIARGLSHGQHFESIFWIRWKNSRFGSESTQNDRVNDLIGHLAEPLRLLGSTQEEIYSATRKAIKSAAYLIVIDNLDVHIQDNKLLTDLQDLSNPSKFLVTARYRPHPLASVYTHELREISIEDSARLIVDQAEMIGIGKMSKDLKKSVAKIYRVVGGNPLALKLVVSLLDSHPLNTVLEDLANNRLNDIEALYRRIYLRAWQRLSESAQKLLEAMPLVSAEGAALEQLTGIRGLSQAQVIKAVYELTRCSLIEARGSLEERRYGIHQLTETFLRADIISWEN